MRQLLIILYLSLLCTVSHSQVQEQFLDFEYEGVKLSGILNLPTDVDIKGLVIIVHGDGQTDAIAGQWWYDVRHSIWEAGYATYMWDKVGCGKSEGIYKSGRDVRDEASEVMAAMENLIENDISGSNNIGLWGISRAGWINPIVIDQSDKINFWISVSGVDDHETFKYLLRENLRIAGYQQDSIDLLVEEWHTGLLQCKQGESYETYLSSIKHLNKNQLWLKLSNGGYSEEQYTEYQKILVNSTLDEETNLPLYIDGFEDMLSNIDIPVLALFGETDMTVDWQKTKELYLKTLDAYTDFTIQSFPSCNHNMWTCETGGLYEFEEENWAYERCDGFLQSITNWLKSLN